MRVALAQLNPTVGDVRGNVRALKGVLEHAAAGRAQLVVCPELYLVGYPPKDLLERGWFVERAIEGLRGVCDLSRAFPRMGILVGCPVRSERGRRSLRNAAVLIRDGEILAERYKALLPSYDVFDEERYFEASPRAQIVDFDGERLGIHICEDAWADSELWDGQCPYDRDPVHELVSDGATVLVNISASPFNVGKEGVRQRLVSGHARRHGVPFVYVWNDPRFPWMRYGSIPVFGASWNQWSGRQYARRVGVTLW